MVQPQPDPSNGQLLHVCAVITGVPGSGDRLELLLTDLAAASHAEQGCVLYSLQRGTENADRFVTVEKWTSKEALDAHLASEHVQVALAGAGEILAEAPMIVATRPVGAGSPEKSNY